MATVARVVQHHDNGCQGKVTPWQRLLRPRKTMETVTRAKIHHGFGCYGRATAWQRLLGLIVTTKTVARVKYDIATNAGDFRNYVNARNRNQPGNQGDEWYTKRLNQEIAVKIVVLYLGQRQMQPEISLMKPFQSSMLWNPTNSYTYKILNNKRNKTTLISYLFSLVKLEFTVGS